MDTPRRSTITCAPAVVTALAALCLCVLVGGCAPGGRPESGWAGDIRRLTAELERRHANLYSQVGRDEFLRAADDLVAALPDMSDDDVKVALARLVAMAGDAHTSILLTSAHIGFGTFPIEARWFPEGLFVIWAGDGWNHLVGCRIIGVGESGVDRVAALVAGLISHENEQWVLSCSPDYILTPEVLVALGVIPEADRALFTMEGPGGGLSQVTLDRVARDGVTGSRHDIANPLFAGPPHGPLYLLRPGTHFWYRYLENEEAMYIKYDSCHGNLGESVAEVGRVFDTRPVKSVIVDLRHNRGGDSRILRPLLTELSRRSHLQGHLYCLISRDTFSSGMLNAIDLKRELGAVLVGEPTGGKPNSFGEGRVLTLPSSGLRVPYSTKHFRWWSDDTPSLEPDVPVDLTAADYFSGRDPVLEAVFRLEDESG